MANGLLPTATSGPENSRAKGPRQVASRYLSTSTDVHTNKDQRGQPHARQAGLVRGYASSALASSTPLHGNRANQFAGSTPGPLHHASMQDTPASRYHGLLHGAGHDASGSKTQRGKATSRQLASLPHTPIATGSRQSSGEFPYSTGPTPMDLGTPAAAQPPRRSTYGTMVHGHETGMSTYSSGGHGHGVGHGAMSDVTMAEAVAVALGSSTGSGIAGGTISSSAGRGGGRGDLPIAQQQRLEELARWREQQAAKAAVDKARKPTATATNRTAGGSSSDMDSMLMPPPSATAMLSARVGAQRSARSRSGGVYESSTPVHAGSRRGSGSGSGVITSMQPPVPQLRLQLASGSAAGFGSGGGSSTVPSSILRRAAHTALPYDSGSDTDELASAHSTCKGLHAPTAMAPPMHTSSSRQQVAWSPLRRMPEDASPSHQRPAAGSRQQQQGQGQLQGGTSMNGQQRLQMQHQVAVSQQQQQCAAVTAGSSGTFAGGKGSAAGSMAAAVAGASGVGADAFPADNARLSLGGAPTLTVQSATAQGPGHSTRDPIRYLHALDLTMRVMAGKVDAASAGRTEKAARQCMHVAGRCAALQAEAAALQALAAHQRAAARMAEAGRVVGPLLGAWQELQVSRTPADGTRAVVRALQAAHSCVPLVDGAGLGIQGPMGQPFPETTCTDEYGIPSTTTGALVINDCSTYAPQHAVDGSAAGASHGWMHAHAMAAALTHGSAMLSEAEEALGLLLQGAQGLQGGAHASAHTAVTAPGNNRQGTPASPHITTTPTRRGAMPGLYTNGSGMGSTAGAVPSFNTAGGAVPSSSTTMVVLPEGGAPAMAQLLAQAHETLAQQLSRMCSVVECLRALHETSLQAKSYRASSSSSSCSVLAPSQKEPRHLQQPPQQQSLAQQVEDTFGLGGW